MVYESDFYTTRRTYSRPSVSSYTVSRPQRYYTVYERPHMYEPFDVTNLYQYAYKNIDDNWEKDYHRNWTANFEPLSIRYKSHLERKTRWSPGDVFSYSDDYDALNGYYVNRLRRGIPYQDTYRYYSHLI